MNEAKIQLFNTGSTPVTGAFVLNVDRTGQIVGSVPYPDIPVGTGLAVDMPLNAVTDPGGKFVISGLPAGSYSACLVRPGLALVQASPTSSPKIVDEIPSSQFEVTNPGGHLQPNTCLVAPRIGGGAANGARTTGPVYFAPNSTRSVTSAEVAVDNTGDAPNTFGVVWVAAVDGSIASQKSVTVDPGRTEVLTFVPTSGTSGSGEWFLPVVCLNGGTVSLNLNLSQFSVTSTGGTTATHKQFSDSAFGSFTEILNASFGGGQFCNK